MRKISDTIPSLIENINAFIETYMHSFDIKTRVDYCFWADNDFRMKPYSNKNLKPTVMSYAFSKNTVICTVTRTCSLLTCGAKKTENLTEQLCSANTAFSAMTIDDAKKYLERVYNSLISSDSCGVGGNSRSLIIRA